MAAAVTGMLAWLAGFALIPLDAKLDKGKQHLVQVLLAHTGQLYAAALLTVLGAVLLAAFFAAPSRRTGSSPGSSRSPPSPGSSPWPPHCRDRGGQPPLPPSKLVSDQGHGRSCSYITHHPARTLPTP
jgi:hypothetical protein